MRRRRASLERAARQPASRCEGTDEEEVRRVERKNELSKRRQRVKSSSRAEETTVCAIKLRIGWEHRTRSALWNRCAPDQSKHC